MGPSVALAPVVLLGMVWCVGPALAMGVTQWLLLPLVQMASAATTLATARTGCIYIFALHRIA